MLLSEFLFVLFVLIEIKLKKPVTSHVTSFWVGGGARTHDLQIHNLAL